MDVSKLKVQELKDELEKRGVPTTKAMKKKDLSDLFEATIAGEEQGSTSNAPTSPTEDAEPALPAVVEASATSPPPPPPQLDDSTSSAPATTSTSADEPKPTFPPVFNENETPLAKTTEELAQIEREEKAGRGEGGVEGAQQAGIAMSVVEPEQKETVKAAEVEMDGEKTVPSTKRSLEEGEVTTESEKLDEVPTKKPRLSSPLPTIPLSSYPLNFLPSSHPPTRALLITNLRRPLADPTLTAHLSSFGSLDTSSASIGKESCGWWLSPVKSHAFVVYESIDSAVKAYTSLQGCTTFPEEDGQGKPALKVTFLPTGPIAGLIKQEVKAWTEEGRRKLELLVERNEETGEWKLCYKGVGDVNLGGARSMGGTGAAGGRVGGGGWNQQQQGGYRAGGGGMGGGFGQQQQYPPQQPRRELGMGAMGSAVTGGGSYVRPPPPPTSNTNNTPNSFTRPPPPVASSSSASTLLPPSSSFPPSTSSTPTTNGFTRPRPPHESSSARPPTASNSYEREGGRRVTEAAPRLSWGERGVDRARGEMGGSSGGRYEREGRREDERRGGSGRDERDGGGRREDWGDRRR